MSVFLKDMFLESLHMVSQMVLHTCHTGRDADDVGFKTKHMILEGKERTQNRGPGMLGDLQNHVLLSTGLPAIWN